LTSGSRPCGGGLSSAWSGSMRRGPASRSVQGLPCSGSGSCLNGSGSPG